MENRAIYFQQVTLSMVVQLNEKQNFLLILSQIVKMHIKLKKFEDKTVMG